MMTRIMENTKKYERLMEDFQRYLRAETKSIYEVYSRPSTDKVRTYGSWVDYINNRFNIYDFAIKILGHNCHQYSLGFIFEHDETGVLCFGKITRDNFIWAEIDAEVWA